MTLKLLLHLDFIKNISAWIWKKNTTFLYGGRTIIGAKIFFLGGGKWISVPFMHVWLFVYVHTHFAYKCICMWVYICKHMCMNVCGRVCFVVECVNVHIYMCRFVHLCLCLFAPCYISMCARIFMYVWVRVVCVFLCLCQHVCAYHICEWELCVGVWVCVCVWCVCVCVCVCVRFVIRVNRGGWPVSHQWIGETHPTVVFSGCSSMVRTMRITCSTVLGAIRWTPHLAVWNQEKCLCNFIPPNWGAPR